MALSKVEIEKINSLYKSLDLKDIEIEHLKQLNSELQDNWQTVSSKLDQILKAVSKPAATKSK